MNFHFDVDCTPEEARQFFGLPDVVPMQEALMQELQARLEDNIRSMEPEALVKMWLPATMQGWSEMQKMFWSQMGVAQDMMANSQDPEDE